MTRRAETNAAMSIDMSTLALCIPAWNAERFLGRLLESAQRQSSPFDEILVFDDASSDRTGDVARSFGATVVRTDTNRGPSHGKNELARLSRCDWVHFHDADEALRAEFSGRAHAWMRDPAVDVVLFGTTDHDDDTGAFLGERVWDDEALRQDPVKYAIQNTITNCGIYRRTPFLAAGGFDVDELTKYNEDQACHLRLAMAGLRFRADPYPAVMVYRRQGSMSSGHPIECVRAQFEVLRQAAATLAPRYVNEIGARLWQLATLSATYSDWQQMRRCLALAAEIGYVVPPHERRLIRVMARVSPMSAVALREAYVRTFKPALRRGVPRAR